MSVTNYNHRKRAAEGASVFFWSLFAAFEFAKAWARSSPRRPRRFAAQMLLSQLLKRNGVGPPIFDVEYGIGGGEGSLSFYEEHLRSRR